MRILLICSFLLIGIVVASYAKDFKTYYRPTYSSGGCGCGKRGLKTYYYGGGGCSCGGGCGCGKSINEKVYESKTYGCSCGCGCGKSLNIEDGHFKTYYYGGGGCGCGRKVEGKTYYYRPYYSGGGGCGCGKTGGIEHLLEVV